MEQSDLSLSFVERDSNELTRNSNVKSHLEEINILEEMGFSGIFIRKVYAFLKPQSLEQAINYMTKENGVYNHNFRTGKRTSKNLCFICGEDERYHFDYIPQNDEEINCNEDCDNLMNSQITKNGEKINEEKECLICIEKYDNSKKERKKIINKNCNHSYCYTCWLHYIQDQIENANVAKITCPNYDCKCNLNEDFIMELIKDDKKLIEKYNKFKLRLEIINDKNKKFCPHLGCDTYAERKNKKEKQVKCQNGHKFCFKCLKNWHGDSDCDLELEKDFQIWKKGKIIKQCPNCKIWTEKNEGCNHMTCVECKYQWCWLCSGKYTSDHYYKGKCNGLQFYKPKNEDDIKKVLSQSNNNNNNINNNFNRYHFPASIHRHILVDRDHPYNPPQRRKREFVSFFYAYVECSLCEYIFWIFIYFTTTILQFGVLFHNNILNVHDPAYQNSLYRNSKVYINKTLDRFIVWSYMIFQFCAYFFFNIGVMFFLSIPLMLYWEFLYGIRQWWWDNLFYNFVTPLGLLINYRDN